jgi:hypothetical protein
VSEWDTRETSARLAAALPDVPRWLETRSMLLDGTGEVLGLVEEPLAFIVRDPDSELFSVVGKPSAEAFQEALYRNEQQGVALVQFEDEAHAAANLPGWRPEPATLHRLPKGVHLPPPPNTVRVVSISDITADPDLPNDLKDELRSAATYTEIAATVVDGRPVSFCYAASETETLWDISIDTLEQYRRQGHAAAVVCFVAICMAERGKEPVWGAEESNAASMGLAAKLGFRPVERLIVFHAPGD